MRRKIVAVILLLTLLSSCSAPATTAPVSNPEPPSPVAAEIPEGPAAEISPPLAALNPYDVTAPLSDEEFRLLNGVALGMRYEQVLDLVGSDKVVFFNHDDDARSFKQAGVFYGFYLNADDSVFYLCNLNIENDADSGEIAAPFFRDIKIGDPLDSVFDKFPVRDRTLKKWAYQQLYGEMKGTAQQNYAYLEFVADSYYSMVLVAETQVARITFSRLEQRVLWVELEFY
jgi:hypothetical protein